MLLDVVDVTKRFGGLRALDGVSLSVEKGEVVLVIGPNGSGKTTLVNVCGGIYRPDGGKIVFDGKDIAGIPAFRVAELGLTRSFQIPIPFTKLTVLENMLVASGNGRGESFVFSTMKSAWERADREKAERALKVLDALSLDRVRDVPAEELSGGQLKLLEIGRALMMRSKLVMLDEPVAGVNPVLSHMIFERLLSLRDKMDLSFLVIEHRLDVALRYVDKVFAMAGGKVVSSGTPEHVLNDPQVIEAYMGGGSA
jgi:branched-chain amino acid transport system ATP-binding protein